MAINAGKAPAEVVELFDRLKEKHHHKRLEHAQIAVVFVEGPAFKKGDFNWGQVKKFDPISKVLLADVGHFDFLIVIPDQSWDFARQSNSTEALADVYLTRCSVEYEPETKTEVKGKSKKEKEVPVKDVWGRLKYTENPKYDEDGNPKWVVLPLGLPVLIENVTRYGPWFDDFKNFKEVIENAG